MYTDIFLIELSARISRHCTKGSRFLVPLKYFGFSQKIQMRSCVVEILEDPDPRIETLLATCSF